VSETTNAWPDLAERQFRLQHNVTALLNTSELDHACLTTNRASLGVKGLDRLQFSGERASERRAQSG